LSSCSADAPVKIGRYEVEGPIGEGGAGIVYRARDGALIVAIKVLKSQRAEAVGRFEREGRLLAALGGGFVPLLDVGVQSGTPYLVFPFIEGGTLRDRLARGPLGVEETR